MSKKYKFEIIKFPAIDLKVNDVILSEKRWPITVVEVSESYIIFDNGRAMERSGLVNLVSRATTSEQTYIQYRNQVWKLLKEQGVSRKHLPGWKFIRPYFNIGAGPDECAANFLNQIEYPEI